MREREFESGMDERFKDSATSAVERKLEDQDKREDSDRSYIEDLRHMRLTKERELHDQKMRHLEDLHVMKMEHQRYLLNHLITDKVEVIAESNLADKTK